MSINNSRGYLDYQAEWGWEFVEHRVTGRNIRFAPDTYPYIDGAPSNVVTFTGTKKGDVLFAGGGEGMAIFMGTKGNDLYGTGSTTEEVGTVLVDYSGARHGVRVDMTYHGTRTFTDAVGETRTTDIVGKAHDGFGGTDYFAATPDDYWFGGGISAVYGVFGSSHRDVMIADDDFYGEFFGGRGNDLLIGNVLHGGVGNDRLISVANAWGGAHVLGDEGNDVLRGSASDDRLQGGTGNDTLRGGDGDDDWMTGEAGNDLVDGGAGDDFIDGGVGRDTLLSGAGNDKINPDVEFFQADPSQPTDHARDVIRVTKADLGDHTDEILFNAFEEDRDRIDFAAAVKGGVAFRVTHEARGDGGVDTILQIDQDDDGFDDADYQLIVAGADLSLHHGYILT